MAGRISAVLALFLMTLGPRAHTETPSSAAFLRVTPSPRSYALGMSKGVTSLGAQAIGVNPANLGLLPQRFEVFTSFAALMSGSQYQHLAAAFNPETLPVVDALGLAVTRVQVSGLPGADEFGNKTGSNFSAGDMALSLSASGKAGEDLRLGATAKSLKSTIGSYRSNMVVAADFGLTYTIPLPDKPLSIGASITNLGKGMKFRGQTDPLPTSLNVGAALPLGPAMAVAEVNRLFVERLTEFGAGLEYGVGPVFFRGGYLVQTGLVNDLTLRQEQKGAERFLHGFSFGLGMNVGMLGLDYAVSQQAVDYGTTHRVALTLRWGPGDDGPSPRRKSGKTLINRSDWLMQPRGGY